MILRFCLNRTAAAARYLRHYSISSKKFLDISVNNETGIATVTMQHAPVNGLSLEFLTELSTIFTELEDNKTKGMILTSLYDKKVFSAGLDLKEVYNPDPVRLRTCWKTLQDTMINLYGTSYPTVAVINGHAPAGGCLLTVCCEYRVMLNNFKIGLNETSVGIYVPAWLSFAMQGIIGKRQTELACTTSKMYTTEEALKIGMIDETASDKAEAMEKAVKFLRRFETISPAARERTKQYLRGPHLEFTHNIREEDLNSIVSLITATETQQIIENQLTQLKKKKRN